MARKLVARGMTKAERARDVREGALLQYRRALAAFRAELEKVKSERRGALGRLREVCRRAKRVQRARLREYRRAEMALLSARIRAAREALAAECKRRIAELRSQSLAKETAIKRAAAERKRIELEARTTEQRLRAEHAKRRKAGEALRESADAVRAELPADLVPVFDAVGHRVKARGKQSRAEAFLHWVHENSGEVLELQARHAGKLAARDIAKLQKQERAMSKRAVRSTRGGPKYSAAELAGLRRLGIDPFAPVPVAVGDAPF